MSESQFNTANPIGTDTPYVLDGYDVSASVITRSIGSDILVLDCYNAAKENHHPKTDAAIKALIAESVADALAEHEANKSYDNRNGSHDSGSGERRIERTTRECTYKEFLNCQLLNFKGTEGVFAWWNSHIKTIGHDAAYGMPWKTLMKMMIDKYCPRSEIKNLEIEIWNLKVKGTDVGSYTQRFQELALMCGRMFLEESDEVEKYVGGLLKMIQGNVMSARPKTMQ
ncbi:reverse transcriptase domain-containing protein [Tanacetum coccineum]